MEGPGGGGSRGWWWSWGGGSRDGRVGSQRVVDLGEVGWGPRGWLRLGGLANGGSLGVVGVQWVVWQGVGVGRDPGGSRCQGWCGGVGL